jgi:hypothetical protein
MKVRYRKDIGKLGMVDKEKPQDYVNETSFFKRVTKRAKSFIKGAVKDIKKNAKKIFKQIKKEFMAAKSKDKFRAGRLIAMNYKAKDAKKKYDKAPLIICLGWSQNKNLKNTHFYGLNLHWLPMKDRVAVATFFVELNKKRGGKLQWGDVKPFLHKFKGSQVLRMYIYNNVMGKVIDMPDDVFLTASAIPSEIWMGN